MDTKSPTEPVVTPNHEDQQTQHAATKGEKTPKGNNIQSELPLDDERIKWDAEVKKYITLALGFIAFAVWVILFIAGINLDSKYYRAAITYNYGDWTDWSMTIVSFTLSNVILLAFLSGFLGGACSKIIYTRGFRLSEKQLEKDGHDNVLFENPVISGFRGVFVFIALLAFQYLSSFSDLGVIGKSTETVAKQQDLNSMYKTIIDSVTDASSKSKIYGIYRREQAQLGAGYNDSIVSRIHSIEDSLKMEVDSAYNRLSTDLRQSRAKVSLPDLADIPGLSSSSYFRFAVIVSLLSFICGYDPTRFGSIINMFQILSAKNKENETGKSKDPQKEPGKQ